MKDKFTTTDFTYDEISKLQRVIELSIKDPRNKALITYPLSVIATVIILARMAGHNNMRAIFEYCSVNIKKLQKIIYGLGDEIPTPQTFRRVTTILNTDNLIDILTNFFVDTCIRKVFDDTSVNIFERDLISCDGQNIRATRSSVNDGDRRKSAGYDIVQMYSSKYGITIAQQVVDKKNQESRAIIEMLKYVNVKNTILAWDAINTHISTMSAVIEAGGDFLCSLKRNQKLTLEEVSFAFQHRDNDYLMQDDKVLSEHGRIEQRHIEILPAEIALSKENQRKFKHVKSIILVQKSVTKKISIGTNERPAKSELFYISSIEVDFDDDTFVAKMDDLIRSRWAVEVDHFIIDVNFDQDRIPLRNRDYIYNSVYFTKIAKNVLKFAQDAIAEFTGKTPPSIRALQHACNDINASFDFLMAYIKNDKSMVMEVEAIYNYGLVKKEEPIIEDNYEPPVKVPKNRLEAIALYGAKKAKELGF